MGILQSGDDEMKKLRTWKGWVVLNSYTNQEMISLFKHFEVDIPENLRHLAFPVTVTEQKKEKTECYT